MQVKVTKLVPYDYVMKAANVCTGKNVQNLDPWKMYKAEHSLIYTQWFWVEVYDIEPYVHTHFRTHEKNGCQFFVSTSRKGQERHQKDSLNMAFICNASHLINMARKRLCGKADPQVRECMLDIRDRIFEIEPALSSAMVTNCSYRGKCYELTPCFKGGDLE